MLDISAAVVRITCFGSQVPSRLVLARLWSGGSPQIELRSDQSLGSVAKPWHLKFLPWRGLVIGPPEPGAASTGRRGDRDCELVGAVLLFQCDGSVLRNA